MSKPILDMFKVSKSSLSSINKLDYNIRKARRASVGQGATGDADSVQQGEKEMHLRKSFYVLPSGSG